jgi:S-adenosylmethionine:tRNA ribosyltransferase-isomerase
MPMIDLRDYDFPLPETRIARFPVTPRDQSALLCTHRSDSSIAHRKFHQIGDLLRAGDVLVLNKTKVLKARLFGQNATGRAFEVLLLAQSASCPTRWRCLVRPGRYIAEEGTRLIFPGDCSATVRRSTEDDRQFDIEFPNTTQEGFLSWLDTHGTVPLPPYLKRAAEAADAQTYQTVYAKEPGSVAAPTAGLHFTPELLEALRAKGVQFETITLTIGYGTFSPLDPAATELHAEPFCIESEVQARLAQARAERRRVIAVGTTALRALESTVDGTLTGTTRLFIRPGYTFTQVDGLITNFHLPQSSLFILISAFMGRENAQAAYGEALKNGYRFFSYGDAMAIL